MTAKRRTCLVLAESCCLLVGLLLPAQADPVTLKGTVLLPDGQPAVGARVVSGSYPPTGFVLHQTTADAAGKFSLTFEGPLRDSVAALLPGHPLALAVPTPGQEVELRFGDQSATLTGLVVDEQGHPLAGVQVGVPMLRLPQLSAAMTLALGPHGTDFPIQGTTGADGRFSIPDLPPGVRLWYAALGPGLAQEFKMYDPGGDELKITLHPEAMLAGRLTCGGQPVAGVRVYVGAWGAWETVTGADGTYRLEHLAAGVTKPSFSGLPEGFAPPLILPITLQAGDHRTGVDYVSTPGALITGKVTVAEDGTPAVGAWVTLLVKDPGGAAASGWTQTDATGDYQLRAEPGHVSVQAHGAPPERLYWKGSPAQRELDVLEGEKHEGLDFTIAPPPPGTNFPLAGGRGATVAGTVTADGQPVPKLRVACYGSNQQWAWATTGADGTYHLEVEAGPVTLAVSPEQGLPEDFTIPIPRQMVLHAGDHLTGQDFTLVHGAVLSGKVTEDDTGHPVAGVSVYVPVLAPPATGPTAQLRENGFNLYATTDAQGAFQFRVPAGSRQVGISQAPADHAHWLRKPANLTVEVAEGDQKEGLNFTLVRPAQVRGRILLADGTPAAGALVGFGGVCYQTGNTWAEKLPYKSGADGAFALDYQKVDWGFPVPPVIAVLAMQPERGLVGWAHMADPAEPLEIRLLPGAFITAQVSDAQGQALAGVQFTASSNPGPAPGPVFALPPAASDAEGRLKIGPLPAGGLMIALAGKDRAYTMDDVWQKNQVIPITEGEARELPPVHLDRRGRSVSGSVLDAAGRPVARAVVLSKVEALGGATTDNHGLFTLNGLPVRGPVLIGAVDRDQPLFGAAVVDPDQGQGAHFILQPLGGLQGQIVGADGKPTNAVTLQLQVPGTDMDIREMVRFLQVCGAGQRAQGSLPGAGEPLPVDAQGRWHVDDVIAGLPYVMVMSGPHSPRRQLGPFEVKPGATTDTGPLALMSQGPPPPAAPGAGGPAPQG